MDCSRWDNAFRTHPIPNCELIEAMFMVSYYTYPYRGDTQDQRISRSQSIVTRWHVYESPIPSEDSFPVQSLVAFFPVYDGIGYWIAKRRREGGGKYYTLSQERALARVSAIGALGMTSYHWTNEPAGTQICRCVWAPDLGQGDSRSAPGILAIALPSLGLERRQVTETDQDGLNISHYQLYGDCYHLKGDRPPRRLRFDCSVPLALRSGWNMLRQIRGSLEAPREESY